MSISSLFNSVVRVERLQLSQQNGRAVMSWTQASDPDPSANQLLSYLPCRLDMNFLRPGKDVAPQPVQGRAPDRLGVMFTYSYAPIKAGDRIVAIPNGRGQIPVSGTFEIRVIPDEAQDYFGSHHIEVQIVETNQKLTEGNWPSNEED